MNNSLAARIGYLFARSAWQLRQRMDPRRSNGGVFLGLNGIVIKSCGGTHEGFAAAIDLGYGIVRDELWQDHRGTRTAHKRSPNPSAGVRRVMVRRSVVLGCGNDRAGSHQRRSRA